MMNRRLSFSFITAFVMLSACGRGGPPVSTPVSVTERRGSLIHAEAPDDQSRHIVTAAQEFLGA